MIIHHQLREARFVPSPFCDHRPDGSVIELLVIHNISLPPGEFGGPYVERLFTQGLTVSDHVLFADIQHLKVSTHLFIQRTGQIVQFVPFDKRAWHAGVSQYKGKPNCNDFSIGIELEGTDTVPYTVQQYEQLISVTRDLKEAYPLFFPHNIVGHCDIAPGRKTDPGPAFDWQRYRQGLLLTV